MPNVLDIRRRIRSVRNTQQITKAMKMVSAAKLRRAQEAILRARPYAGQILEVVRSLMARSEIRRHPLLEEREEKSIQLVVVTADKGLCGAFNANIVKAAEGFIREKGDRSLDLFCVGRKGLEYFGKRTTPIRHRQVNLFQRVEYAHARQITGKLVSQFLSGERDAVYLLYNEFKSVIQQRIAVERLLPIPPIALSPEQSPVDYIYEQPAAVILNTLMPRHVEVQVFRALLESSAAEHGARMTAMDAATNNAVEMIESLTLTMNRARQAGITKEIIEVVSGAAALT
ncbi:MAG: ATP synthase F1 subunit gamma [Acidobacteriota bacterium]|nr:ATP synthase F1 subunit gamma [Acidobacteriota bacterium]